MNVLPADVGSDTGHPPLTVRQHLLLNFLWFCLDFQAAALLPIIVPLQVVLFISHGAIGNIHQAVFLGWLASMGAIASMFVQPIIGSFSDRTTSPLGRRRPYIILGVFLLMLAIAALWLSRNLFFFVLGFLLFEIAYNICTAAYQSLIPDLVPVRQRGMATGFYGLMTILGNVAGLGTAAILLGGVTAASSASVIRGDASHFYLLAVAVLLIGLPVTVLGVRERRVTPAEVARTHHQPQKTSRQRWLVYWLAPWRHRNFRLVFLTRSSIMMGLTLFLNFIEFYFARVAHLNNFVQATAVVAVLALVGAVFSALILGILSDRVGRVPVVSFATGCMATASLAFVLFPDHLPLLPLGVLFGLGYGAYTSVNWALAIDSLPQASSAGKDLGLWNIAATLPAVIAPLLGNLVLSLADHTGNIVVGYRTVFAIAVVFMVAGAIFVLMIKEKAKEAAKQPAIVGYTLAGRTLALRAAPVSARLRVVRRSVNKTHGITFGLAALPLPSLPLPPPGPYAGERATFLYQQTSGTRRQ